MKTFDIPKELSLILILPFVCLICSCHSKVNEGDSESQEVTPIQAEEDGVPEVKITKAEIKAFRKRLWSNGTLQATRSFQIKSHIKSRIDELLIGDRDVVKKDQLLLRFDDTDWQIQIKHANLDLEEAIYKKNDLLVLQGGKWAVDSSVNRQTLDNILLESGLKRARLNLEELERQHQYYEIYAPFDGVIANLKVQLLQDIESGIDLFTFFDPESMEAEFQLMETELAQISKGQIVKLFPIGLDSVNISAKLAGINPVIDNHGLVKVKAKISDKYTLKKMNLPDGIAVKVAIEKIIPDQLVIPRSAVVLRSEKPVVFSWDQDSGLAKWNFVTISMEEQNEVVISEGLDNGTWIIFEGNLNLDHDAAVKVVNQPNSIHH